MKQIPDILSFQQWLSNLSQDDKIDMLEITLEEYLHDDPINDSIECPSCDGNGTIDLDYEFKDEHGRPIYTEYHVDCEYCDGEGTISDGYECWDDKLEPIYNNLVKQDKIKYAEYIKCNQH